METSRRFSTHFTLLIHLEREQKKNERKLIRSEWFQHSSQPTPTPSQPQHAKPTRNSNIVTSPASQFVPTFQRKQLARAHKCHDLRPRRDPPRWRSPCGFVPGDVRVVKQNPCTNWGDTEVKYISLLTPRPTRRTRQHEAQTHHTWSDTDVLMDVPK